MSSQTLIEKIWKGNPGISTILFLCAISYLIWGIMDSTIPLTEEAGHWIGRFERGVKQVPARSDGLFLATAGKWVGVFGLRAREVFLEWTCGIVAILGLFWAWRLGQHKQVGSIETFLAIAWAFFASQHAISITQTGNLDVFQIVLVAGIFLAFHKNRYAAVGLLGACLAWEGLLFWPVIAGLSLGQFKRMRQGQSGFKAMISAFAIFFVVGWLLTMMTHQGFFWPGALSGSGFMHADSPWWQGLSDTSRWLLLACVAIQALWMIFFGQIKDFLSPLSMTIFTALIGTSILLISGLVQAETGWIYLEFLLLFQGVLWFYVIRNPRWQLLSAFVCVGIMLAGHWRWGSYSTPNFKTKERMEEGQWMAWWGNEVLRERLSNVIQPSGQPGWFLIQDGKASALQNSERTVVSPHLPAAQVLKEIDRSKPSAVCLPADRVYLAELARRKYKVIHWFYEPAWHFKTPWALWMKVTSVDDCFFTEPLPLEALTGPVESTGETVDGSIVHISNGAHIAFNDSDLVAFQAGLAVFGKGDYHINIHLSHSDTTTNTISVPYWMLEYRSATGILPIDIVLKPENMPYEMLFELPADHEALLIYPTVGRRPR